VQNLQTHLLNKFFLFLATFFARFASKFEKVLILPKKKIFLKKSKKLSKTAEFHADFKMQEQLKNWKFFFMNMS
jgi:hypothetical protein